MRQVMQVATLLVAFAALASCGRENADGGDADGGTRSGLDPAKRREWAAALDADGLDEQALAVYESLIADGALADDAVAAVSLKIADIHIAHGRFEKALASLYRARVFGASGELGRRVEEKRILCLEKLGRHAEADRLLTKATRVGGADTTTAGGNEVLAKTPTGEIITRAALDDLVANLPPDMRAHLESKEARREFLRSLVAQKILAADAKKLGFENDPKVRMAMDLAAQEILVKKMMAERVKDEVSIDDDDVRLYYEAHKEELGKPAELELAAIVVPDEEAENAVRAELAQGSTFESLVARMSRSTEGMDEHGRIAERVVKGRYHPLFVDVDSVFAAVGDTPIGQVAPKPVVTASGRYVVKVLDRSEPVIPAFDEVKERARALLRAEREAAAIQKLLRETLERPGVEIHEDKL